MKTTHSIIIGIDTHKATHVAVAIDTQGTRLAALSIPTNPKGYLELERWSQSFGDVLHSESKGLVRMVRAYPGLCWLKATMSLRSHDQTDSCDTQKAKQTVWMQRAQHDLFSLGRQQHDLKHKQGHPK
jgi:hypothetical protein